MQIAGNRHRFDLEDRQHVPESFLEECDRVRRVEIADMLRDKRFAAARDRYRCLELSPQGDDARNLVRQTDRRRRKAARAAQEGGRPGHDANHAVVGARHDRSIMIGDHVGDAGEAAARIGAVDDDRFAGDVGRGRDQRQIGGRRNPVERRRDARAVPRSPASAAAYRAGTARLSAVRWRYLAPAGPRRAPAR